MASWVEQYDLSRQQWIELIDSYIFNELYREIVKRRWLDGITNEKVAEEFDLTPRHTANICSACKKRIIPHI